MRKPDEEVTIMKSTCKTCNGDVRLCVTHAMNSRDITEFTNEVIKHDLSVSTIPLLQFRSENSPLCTC